MKRGFQELDRKDMMNLWPWWYYFVGMTDNPWVIKWAYDHFGGYPPTHCA